MTHAPSTTPGTADEPKPWWKCDSYASDRVTVGEKDEHATIAESLDRICTHSQNSSTVGLMSLLPADAVQSPKVILSESRHEQTMTDGGTQVAGELILRRKRAKETDDDSTGQIWESPLPRNWASNHRITKNGRPTVTDSDGETKVRVKSEHIINSVECWSATFSMTWLHNTGILHIWRI